MALTRTGSDAGSKLNKASPLGEVDSRNMASHSVQDASKPV
jgi:hypothetical protein